MRRTWAGLIIVIVYLVAASAVSAKLRNAGDILLVGESSTQRTDNPPGKCLPEAKEGSKCREGVCSKGKQTIYRCDAEHNCKYSGKEPCDETSSGKLDTK
jgi:hypothetical protein